MDTNKKATVVISGNPYGSLPLGSFLGEVYKIKKHVLANDKDKLNDFNVIEAVSVLNIDEISIKSLREIDVMGKVPQIIIYEDENLIFPKDRTFSSKITDKVDYDKTILGDERTALYACRLINQENHDELEAHISELMDSLQSLKTTIDRQDARIKEIDRKA